VLTDPHHLNIDLGPDGKRDAQNPLLLLYLISKDSKAKGDQPSDPILQQRIDLFRFVDTRKTDVLGIGILFPLSEFEDDHYIGQ
jgi:hypothetical protein